MWGHPGKKLLFMGQEFAQAREWNHGAELDWGALDDPRHAGMQRLVRDLNTLYRANAALHVSTPIPGGSSGSRPTTRPIRSMPGSGAADRTDPNVVVVCNFTPSSAPGYGWACRAAGPWREALNTDAAIYGGVVLAGGRGSRLKELTDRRAKPAVYFGGKTRIIDFALSNALNSGIRKMAVATQYKAHSLIRHLQRGWSFFRAERNEYLDILPASQRVTRRNGISARPMR
jgi:hypothetical protein